MKTLHVHIGTPKTATTAIQQFCLDNETILKKYGYCFPIFPFTYVKVSDVRNGHFLVGDVKGEDGAVCKEEIDLRFRTCMEKIQQLFEEFDHVILSDEAIWRGMDANRKNFWDDLGREAKARNFQIHVIVYLRRQDKFLMSLYRQTMKARGKSMHLEESTLEEYMQKINFGMRFDYDAKLEKVAQVIGKEQITVRRFERGYFEGGTIYSDFLSAIGLALTEEYEVPDGIVNLSLNGNTHEFKRVLNGLEQMEDKDANIFMMNRLREFSEVSAKQYPCELLSKEEAENFLKQYEEGNRRIAREYLQEPDGELFDSTVRDLPKWQKDNPYVADDLTRLIGVTGIRLYQELRSLRQEVRDLKKEINDLKKNEIGGLKRDYKDFKYKLRHPLRTTVNRFGKKPNGEG